MSAARRPPAGTPLISAVATRTSPRWPGVASMAMGRPRASTMAWIFVVRPPRERPIACACAPLFRPPPSGEPWPSCCRWLDHRRGRRAPARQQPTPDPAHRPAAKAIVERRRRPVHGRAILPPTAGLQNGDDAADDPPVVSPSRAPGWFLGNSGPRAPHCASLNQNSPAMIQALKPDSP